MQAAPERMVWGSDWPHPTEPSPTSRTTPCCSICSRNGRRTRRPAIVSWWRIPQVVRLSSRRMSEARLVTAACRLGTAPASVVCGAGGLAAELAELAGAQVARDELALRLGLGEEVHVSLAPSCAPRWRTCARFSVAASLRPQLMCSTRVGRPCSGAPPWPRQRRTLDQAVYGVHVALGRGAAPKVEARRQVLRHAQRDGLRRRLAVPDWRNTEDTTGHGA